MGSFGGRPIGINAAVALACLALPGAAQAVPPFPGSPPPELARASGSRLVTTSNGDWTFGAPTSYTYRWLRCGTGCSAIAGATAPSYVLRSADIGYEIRSEVTAYNEDGSSMNYSEALGPIAASPPVARNIPEIAGVALTGQTLSSTPGNWTGRVAGDPAYRYRWQRCSTSRSACSNIAGATRSTYKLAPADRGRYLRVLVTAEGLGTAQARSLPLGRIGSPAGDAADRLRPFPVISIVGRLRGRRTTITDFVLRAPPGAKVVLRCKGTRCPFRRASATVGRRKRLRIRRAQRTYRVGQVLEVRVTARDRIGKFTRIAFRRSRPPRRQDLCLPPRTTKPVRC